MAQLAGAVSEVSGYHHGEVSHNDVWRAATCAHSASNCCCNNYCFFQVSLQGTIMNMAMDWPGSNNLNLLLPVGSFGSRLKLGKDAAAARYIHTVLR